VNIKHLDGSELIEHGPGGQAASKRSEPGASTAPESHPRSVFASTAPIGERPERISKN
jgi:hypothetical protein